MGAPWATLGHLWEPIVLTFEGKVSQKAFKKRVPSRAIPGHALIHFLIDFGAKSERPNMQSDRARSIQTHVGTFLI